MKLYPLEELVKSLVFIIFHLILSITLTNSLLMFSVKVSSTLLERRDSPILNTYFTLCIFIHVRHPEWQYFITELEK